MRSLLSKKRLLQALFLIVGGVLSAYFIFAIPHRVSGDPAPPFTRGQFVLSERVTYLLHDPKPGDRIIFKNKESREYVGVILSIEADGNVTKYRVRSSAQAEWVVSRDKISQRLYYPLVSSQQSALQPPGDTERAPTEVSLQTPQPTPYVEPKKPELYFVDNSGSYASSILISQTPSDKPTVWLKGRNISGTARIAIYSAPEETLLDYLIHDKEYKQINTQVDTTRMNIAGSLEKEVSYSEYGDTEIALPLSETGIWFVKAKLDATVGQVFVARSPIGTVVKEGDNELIFWAQDFKTRRSVTDGLIKVYALQDTKKELAATSFDAQGIAKLSLNPAADVALVYRGDDRTVVSINLKRLNSYHNQMFSEKKKQTKYFIFTDRPLYKPGDTVYYKAVIRDDDDARYTVPTGNYRVRVTQYSEEPVYEKIQQVGSSGTLFGEFKLPVSVSTGSYSLNIALPAAVPDHFSEGGTSFQVEHFRKPEYSIEITPRDTELVAGDASSFTVKGNYFFGQPIANQKVKYSIYASSFYEYTYLQDLQYVTKDDYLYGYRWGNKVTEGAGTFDSKGESTVGFIARISPEGVGKSQVYSIEAEFDDGSGNPAVARKNILVHAAEFGVYRKEYGNSAKVGESVSLPLVVVSHRKTSVSAMSLTAKIMRFSWVPYEDPNEKYTQSREERENFPDIAARTDNAGNVVFSITPTKIGTYTFTVSGQDTKGNKLSKEFSIWASAEGQDYYNIDNVQKISLTLDKTVYQPTDRAFVAISSVVPDRDVLVTFERARVNRYHVVQLSGKRGTVELPIETTDMPNIYLAATSFSDEELDTDAEKIVVSTEGKKIKVTVTPDRQKYGPGDTVRLNVQTTDAAGNPVSAETAVWAVDKALFELADTNFGDIFDRFWSERYNDTATTHSLEGIQGDFGGGGGCFSGNTKVLMANGTNLPIAHVRKGDRILTRENPSSITLVAATVMGTHAQQVAGYLVLNGEIQVTPNHRMWVNDSWMNAGSIQTGDRLMDREGRPVRVQSIEWAQGTFTVYNLEIDRYNTYFAGGVWAHNQKGNGGGREVFKDTAYWNPQVSTDSIGRAQLTFKLPDNLTTWVVASVGSTADTKVGQTTSEIIVSKDLIIRPLIPNILRESDNIVLSALVQNFTEQDQKVDVDLRFNAGEVKTATHSAILISAKQFKQLYWDVIPAREQEAGELVFSARSRTNKQLSDTIRQRIPVRSFGFTEQRAEVGEGTKAYTLKLADDILQKKSKITLSLASSITGTIAPALKYLIDYPYGCVEQTTSRFVPVLLAQRSPKLFAKVVEEKDLSDMIMAGLARLAALQHGDGGWSWWNSGNSDPFITAYVIEYLDVAKQAGFQVDASILSRAQTFLERETSNIYDEKTSAYLPYSREDRIMKAYGLTFLDSKKWKEQLTDLKGVSPELLAYAVLTNVHNGYTDANTNGMSQLISTAQYQGGAVFWEAGADTRFGSQDASTAIALRAVMTDSKNRDTALKAVRFLARNRKKDYWTNTFATVQVARALTEYATYSKELSPNLIYVVSLDGKELSRGSITSSESTVPDVVIPADKVRSGGSNLLVTKVGDGQLYSTVVISEFHTDRNAPALNGELSVKREYESEQGPGFSLAVGNMVKVKITVSGLKADEQYGVIADELPAGLIPINEALKNQDYREAERNYYRSYDVTDRDVTENGIVLSLYRVGTGERTYTYKARVVSEGSFIVPPAFASLMYAPEIYGRSAAQVVTTTREPQRIPIDNVKKAVESISKYQTVLLTAVLFAILFAGTGVWIVRRRRNSQNHSS